METSYPLEKIRVALLEGVHPRAAEMLSEKGYTVDVRPDALAGDELIEYAADAHILGIRSKTQITEEFLDQTRRLWAIGCFCIGTNQVD
ncbi:MAG: phosphoglycerate dehydrogenase, partial [Planctomycetota bacterium]|nr:phosphoglycerate dehydrogenase [Planctomycetota bacterium]